MHSIFEYLETQFGVTEGLNYSEKFIDALAELVLNKAENKAKDLKTLLSQ